MNSIANQILIIVLLNLGNLIESRCSAQTEYGQNLDMASELYLEGKEISESILIKLVPENYTEFGIYYGTTSSEDKLGKTDFFYDTTKLIFEQVVNKKNDKFYISSLNLASYADGEYAEQFIDYLEEIINADKQKFCRSLSQIKL